MVQDDIFMRRCLQLAVLGVGYTAPNPMVGAVLVHNNRIIGEGYHRRFGAAHAEVECLNAVAEVDRPLINESTLYVSLEPCDHFGKTPPCSALIISQGIKKVVVGCTDHSPKVNGHGIARLREAGIDVICDVQKEACEWINRRFFYSNTYQQPYVVLKWAESADGIMGSTTQRIKISNSFSDRLVHRVRAQEAAIFVGYQTALQDDPQLTVRLAAGQNPIRLVTDRYAELPPQLHLLDGKTPTLVLNERLSKTEGLIEYIQVNGLTQTTELLQILYKKNIQSVLVEGGAKLLNHFIRQNAWQEAIVIQGAGYLHEGIRSPQLPHNFLVESLRLKDDRILFYQNTAPVR